MLLCGEPISNTDAGIDVGTATANALREKFGDTASDVAITQRTNALGEMRAIWDAIVERLRD